jgi:hypothetical protein
VLNYAPRYERVLRSWGIAPRILNLSTKVRLSGQHASTALPPGKEPLEPTAQEVGGGGQNRSACGGEEKNSQLPPGVEPFPKAYQI